VRKTARCSAGGEHVEIPVHDDRGVKAGVLTSNEQRQSTSPTLHHSHGTVVKHVAFFTCNLWESLKLGTLACEAYMAWMTLYKIDLPIHNANKQHHRTDSPILQHMQCAVALELACTMYQDPQPPIEIKFHHSPPCLHSSLCC
jgi:hypothetical protein